MISRIFGKIIGEREITCEGENRTNLLNLIEETHEQVYAARFFGDVFSCRLFSNEAKRFQQECERRGIEINLSELKGLPRIVYKYRKRYGLMIGAFFMAAAVFFSRYFIWDMRVTGNSNVPSSVIIEQLEGLGCSPGAYIPSLDFELLANRFLLDSSDIVWISVNMSSSVANVEVLERQQPLTGVVPERRRGEGSANLIASEDAEIIRATVTSGLRVVSPGDVVRRGELLASGEITMRDGKVRYEYAFGEVLGKVFREIRVEVPLEGEKKNYTGRETEQKNVKIFGKSKNLFGNGGIEYVKYDRIIKEEKLTVFGVVNLPVIVRSETEREYVTEPCSYTKSEAKEIARREYRDELDALLAEGEIASVERSESFENGQYIIVGKVYLIKDVAQISEPRSANKTGETDDSKNDNN